MLIADDVPACRELIASVLRHAGYEVLEADRGEHALELARSRQPDLIVVVDEVRRLAAACGVADPVAPLPSEEFHREHLRLLNATLLQKVEELRETVILAGTLQRESEPRDGYATWPAVPDRPEVESLLSRRELEVLSMIVDGATNSEIADRLVIATSTVQSHVKRILHKLDVKNRTEAAVRYVRR